MPRGIMNKVDILSRVLRLKKNLGEGAYDYQSREFREGYDHALNQVLDMIGEYSQ